MATPKEMADKMLLNLKEKTGKTLSDWISIIGQSKKVKHGEIITYLKAEEGITHGYANLLARLFNERKNGTQNEEELILLQYKGKEQLMPIYYKIVGLANELGDDVEIAPKKTYVSLRRKKQFALIQPSTKSRIDLGINLKDVDPNGRLEPSGSFNSMVSHRIRISSLADVDKEVLKYLKKAYSKA